MSSTAAAGGFVLFALSASVVRGQADWGVTYASTKICALKGSTVEIHCTYRFPSGINSVSTEVEETFWFTKLQDKEPVDLRTDSEHAGRLAYHCGKNNCTLRIADLRESDSAVYRFRFITNQPGWSFTGSPGVTLSVTGLDVQTSYSERCIIEKCRWYFLRCHSSCPVADPRSYIWYKNGELFKEQGDYEGYFYQGSSISCAVKGHEAFHSPSLCVHSRCSQLTYADRSICAFRGSSVDISCTYNSSEHITSKFWFKSEPDDTRWPRVQPVDLSEDSRYAGRVQVFETEGGRSSLRISDLRETDSAEYRFKFRTRGFEWRSSLPGTTLTVTDPDLQVQVIRSSAGPKLICHSSCFLPGRSSFVWYKNGGKIQGERSASFRGYVEPAGSYSCAYEDYRSLPVYAPKVPSVLMSRPGDIMKDSPVSLNCSSDANPAAHYTWYKGNQTLLRREARLVFGSIQSSDSGAYYCTAENELGRETSHCVSINVKYGPQTPAVSVSPSGEIVEGSSVNLTCSSDANPAANYTWYKGNQTLLQGPEGFYHFTSISSEDRGFYRCKAENRFGRINSTSLFLDVQYAPKLVSVSASPSGEIMEGSSVNLTCSSDANPAANYTWYMGNEGSPQASGQIFAITDYRRELIGSYYCEARNKRGRRNNTLHLTVVAGAWKPAGTGTISAFLLAIAVLAAFLWIRNDSFTRRCTQRWRRGERPDNGAQLDVGPAPHTPSAAAHRNPAEQEPELHYSSICFSQNQADAVYHSVRPFDSGREDGVVYAAVRCDDASGAPGTRRQEDGGDLFALYSTVNKNHENTT
ncbi:sialoadhesin-like isoform X2 [Xiphias gladius]|uniref:sialoadhesin-like isoform X2 n=1 Tax=Xiphias gladius TaxID=8245 RepID=UPI001A997348|nr:sialoadhesin-like isoform X2 [Xiphias gladius]